MTEGREGRVEKRKKGKDGMKRKKMLRKKIMDKKVQFQVKKKKFHK